MHKASEYGTSPCKTLRFMMTHGSSFEQDPMCTNSHNVFYTTPWSNLQTRYYF